MREISGSSQPLKAAKRRQNPGPVREPAEETIRMVLESLRGELSQHCEHQPVMRAGRVRRNLSLSATLKVGDLSTLSKPSGCKSFLGDIVIDSQDANFSCRLA